MVQVTISYPEYVGNAHKFTTAMEAARFLVAIPSLPDDARITIRVEEYRVVCHMIDDTKRWLRVMTDGTIRTTRSQADATILPTREETYQYCDRANLIAVVDYAAPETV